MPHGMAMPFPEEAPYERADEEGNA
jgi:hypothetical protein